MVRPHNRIDSTASPDDDPTGVRALLSALPEPDPMPAHLVERISASLAAEQAQRAARTTGASVSPLLDTARRRPGRLLFAMTGAAAAVALVAVVGSSVLNANQSSTTVSGRASAPLSQSAPEAASEAPQSFDDKSASDRATTPSPVQIRVSDTPYARAGFATQARALRDAAPAPLQPMAVTSSALGSASTTQGLAECLKALGVHGAPAVRADIALYEGEPAVIIVATTDGIPVAFAVGRQCSPAGVVVLHAATPLR